MEYLDMNLRTYSRNLHLEQAIYEINIGLDQLNSYDFPTLLISLDLTKLPGLDVDGTYMDTSEFRKDLGLIYRAERNMLKNVYHLAELEMGSSQKKAEE